MTQSAKLSVSGHIDVPKNARSKFGEFLMEHIRLTREEPGCVHFEITPDNQVPGRFTIEEEFLNRAAFEIHTARTRASGWWQYTSDFARDLKISET